MNFTKEEVLKMREVLLSATSLWGFMSRDESVPIDERLAANQRHIDGLELILMIEQRYTTLFS